MGNKKIKKVHVNKEYFNEVLRQHNCSIRKLGAEYEKIGRTDRTIRRCLDAGEMPCELLDCIAKYLDVHPDYLAGKYYEAAKKIEDPVLRNLLMTNNKPENHPYILKAQSDIGYPKYFENILAMNDITMEDFNTLPPIERVFFRQELNVAILEVIARHFKKDSLGNDLNEQLAHCKSMVDDFDPFSYYAELEGINLPEPRNLEK